MSKTTRPLPKSLMILFALLIFLSFMSLIVLISVYYDSKESEDEVRLQLTSIVNGQFFFNLYNPVFFQSTP
jgi:uncharacterized membrane-anchored protein